LRTGAPARVADKGCLVIAMGFDMYCALGPLVPVEMTDFEIEGNGVPPDPVAARWARSAGLAS
jgi:hypothetical protein